MLEGIPKKKTYLNLYSIDFVTYKFRNCFFNCRENYIFYNSLMAQELVIPPIFKIKFHNMQPYASAERIAEQHALSAFIYRYKKITTSWRQEFNFDLYDNNCKRATRFIYHNQKVLSLQYLFVKRKMRSSGTT